MEEIIKHPGLRGEKHHQVLVSSQEELDSVHADMLAAGYPDTSYITRLGDTSGNYIVAFNLIPGSQPYYGIAGPYSKSTSERYSTYTYAQWKEKMAEVWMKNRKHHNDLTVDKEYRLFKRRDAANPHVIDNVGDVHSVWGRDYEQTWPLLPTPKQKDGTIRVRCIDADDTYLEKGKEYDAIVTSRGEYRIVYQGNASYDYTSHRFEIVTPKKIIGYKAPFDMYDGEVKKGHIWRLDKSDPDTAKWSLPHEIVEKWEPVYEPEKPTFKEFKIAGFAYKVSKGEISTNNCSGNWENVTKYLSLVRSIVLTNKSGDSEIPRILIHGRRLEASELARITELYDEFQKQFNT